MYVFMYLATSDVQAVSATVVGESTIDIQCWFIHGSDALGCKVVLVSDYPYINNVQVHLSRNNTSASGQLSLTHNISCYQRVFAFDIDVNNTTSNLAVEGNIVVKAATDCVYYCIVSWSFSSSTVMHVHNDNTFIVCYCSQVRRSFL